MRLSRLLELLEEAREHVGLEDPEVDLMFQESWPFECDLLGVTTTTAIEYEQRAEDGDEDGAEGEEEEKPEGRIFIVEGRQLRYGSKLAWSTVCQ